MLLPWKHAWYIPLLVPSNMFRHLSWLDVVFDSPFYLSYSDDTDDFLTPVRLSPINPLLGITSVPLATQPLTLPCVTCHHRHPRDCDTVSPCRLGSSRGTPLGTISRLINTIWSFRANWRSLLTRELLECKQRDDGDRLNCWTADEA